MLTPSATPVDRDFLNLMKVIQSKNEPELKQTIKENLYTFRKNDKQNYASTIEYYNKYKLWGQIYPERGTYELIDNRAHALSEHSSDFIWLYNHLSDTRSRKTLLNILDYWINFNWKKIDELIDKTYRQYFDLDLLNCDENEVFVDVGAFVGDTLSIYLNVFGANCYKKYHCYEIMPSNIQKINAFINQNDLKNVEIHAKGASDKAGFMYVEDEGISSVGQLAQSGNIKIPTVTIDSDIDEPVSFLKMDIEGAEESALLGCQNIIKRDHPKLALSVYHNHKDLWKLARIIYECDPTYRFYLRYYGGNLVPTEYLLYAI